jgi:hypothetical protein
MIRSGPDEVSAVPAGSLAAERDVVVRNVSIMNRLVILGILIRVPPLSCARLVNLLKIRCILLSSLPDLPIS